VRKLQIREKLAREKLKTRYFCDTSVGCLEWLEYSKKGN
jgi:hypothetical protein